MKIKKLLSVFALSVLFCGGISACGSTNSGEKADGPLYVYLTNTPIGVNKFLEGGKKGVEAAAKKFNATVKTFEGTDQTSMRQNMESAIALKPDYIVAITYEFTEISKEYAEKYPEQKFILIDDCPPKDQPKNLYCAVFREHEASYLLGYEAGLLAPAGKVGSVGAVDIPFIHRYTDAFAQGAKAANPKAEDKQLFIGGENPFSDPAKAKEQAAALLAGGVTNIFAAGAGSNGGIFEAVGAAKQTAYGVDVNQCPDTPGAIGDGTLKLFDQFVPDLITKINEGKAKAVNSYGLKENGMDIVSLHDGAAESQCTVMKHPEVIEKLKKVKQDIIAGKIKPKDATGVYK